MKAAQYILILILYLIISSKISAIGISPNDTVVFYGDSITTLRIYPAYVTNYFSMRYPNNTIRFINSGKAGDTAPGGLDRFSTDVLSYNPTVVTFLFGMNDSVYSDYTSTYISSLDTMKKQLAQKNAKSVMISSTPRDDEAWNGYHNARISDMAKLLQTFTTNNQIPFFNTFNLATGAIDSIRTVNPSFEFTDDGVHPKFPGQVMLAYSLLSATGDNKKPSNTQIDATAKNINCLYCTVTDLIITDSQVTFTKVDDSLPLFIHPEYSILSKFNPIENYNKDYILKINNLSVGDWDVFANDIFLGTFSNNDLSQGVDFGKTIGPWTSYSEQIYHWSNMQLYDINVPDHDAIRIENETRRLSMLSDKNQRSWKYKLVRNSNIGVSVNSGPLHGTVSSAYKDQKGVYINYTPNTNYVGSDSFTYTINIGSTSKTAKVNINVYSSTFNPTDNLIANYTFEDQSPITITVYPYLVATDQRISLNKTTSIYLNTRWNNDKRLVSDNSSSGLDLVKEDNIKATSGKFGTGMYFDGNHDSLYLTDLEKLNSTNTGTYAFWIKTDGNWGMDGASNGYTAKGDAAVLFRQSVFGRSDGYTLYLTAQGTPAVYFTDSTGDTSFTLTTSKNLTDDKWHHVVFVYNKNKGGVNKIYIDGSLSSQVASTFSWNFRSDIPLRIGASWHFWYEEFKGSLDDINIFNRELNATEVTALYQNIPTVSPIPSNTPVPSINTKFDVNKDGVVNVLDAITVISEIFK